MPMSTAGRGAALLALAALLLSAPVAWALGELSQKPGTAQAATKSLRPFSLTAHAKRSVCAIAHCATKPP